MLPHHNHPEEGCALGVGFLDFPRPPRLLTLCLLHRHKPATVLSTEVHAEAGMMGKGWAETHVSGPDGDSLMNHVHAWDNHTHLPWPLET